MLVVGRQQEGDFGNENGRFILITPLFDAVGALVTIGAIYY